MTLRLWFLSLIGLSAYLMLRRSRSGELSHDHWLFCQEADGKWTWSNMKKNHAYMSSQRFDTDIEAVADAFANGFRLSFSTMAPIPECATPAYNVAPPMLHQRPAGSIRQSRSRRHRTLSHRRLGLSQQDRAEPSEPKAVGCERVDCVEDGEHVRDASHMGAASRA